MRIRTLVGLFVFAGSLATAPSSLAHEPPNDPPGAPKCLTWMRNELHLTPEQMAQFQHVSATMLPGAARDRAMEAVLTPSQRKRAHRLKAGDC